MDVIDKINTILKERGMNGAELSRLIGVSNAVYSQWNTRKTKPSNKNIVKVANALNIPVSELTGEKQEEKPAHDVDEPMPPKEYETLTPEQRKIVDDLIRSLAAQNPK